MCPHVVFSQTPPWHTNEQTSNQQRLPHLVLLALRDERKVVYLCQIVCVVQPERGLSGTKWVARRQSVSGDQTLYKGCGYALGGTIQVAEGLVKGGEVQEPACAFLTRECYCRLAINDHLALQDKQNKTGQSHCQTTAIKQRCCERC